MQPRHDKARFAERSVRGRDDGGAPEVVTLWIDRLPGAVWSVGRAVNVEQRENAAPRPEDEIFSGYEMADALRAANDALESDLDASEDNDDHNIGVRPFVESELAKHLERWFFDHA